MIAQTLIIGTLVVASQTEYFRNMDMGFNKEAIINFELPFGRSRDTTAIHSKELLNKLKSLPGIALASTGFVAPATDGGSFTNLSYNNGKEDLKPETQIRWGDTNFIKVYQKFLYAVACCNISPRQ